MTRYASRIRLLAAGLSGLAGFVDAVAYISLGGFFVSFMSGNSTRLAVGAARGSGEALVALGLIATFVTGAVVGMATGRRAGARRRPAVIALVAALLMVAAGLAAWGARAGAVVAMALAMGAENAVFEHDGEVRIGLTYMTGTLVKLAQRIEQALRGGDPLGWAPYLLLWVGLVAGAVAGAIAYGALGLGALWIAAAAAAGLALVAGAIGPDEA